MTVAVGTRLDQSGDGTTTVFFPTFTAKDETAFTVTLELDADFSKTDQLLATDYTVTFADGTSGVPTVVMLIAPPVGTTIRIAPVAVIAQPNAIGSTSPLFGSSVELSQDQLVAMMQYLLDLSEQSIRTPQDDPPINLLPDAKDRLDKFLFFNATTGQPEVKDLALIQADLGMLDQDLADIAALTPANDDLIQRKAGTWTNRTLVQYAIDLLTKAADGTLALPGIAFASDPDTGLFRSGANTLSLVTQALARVTVDGDGHVTFPTSSAFLAFANSDILDVTGDGTPYTMLFNTEVHDRNSDFVPATGIYTAAVTGLHDFSGGISLLEVGAATSILVELVTSNRTYQLINIAGADDVSNATTLNWSVVGADMDAADTAFVRLTVAGTTLTVDVDGDASVAKTFFSGRLVA